MGQHNIIKFIRQFEEYLRSMNYADRTVAIIIRNLEVFTKYALTQGVDSVDGISADLVKSWQIHLYQSINHRGKPYHARTRNSFLYSVKKFTEYLKKNDYIVTDAARDIEFAIEPKHLPRSILTVSEVRNIVNAPDTQTVLGYRDRVILEVLYATGIRLSELINIRVDNVDVYEEIIHIIRGKGKKDRVVPTGKIAARYLENYIHIVRKELIKDLHDDYLFFTIRGEKLSGDAVRGLIKKYARIVGIKKNVHCHTFRHTCATAMLKNKANIRAVQELLGHSSLQTTQVYTHVSIADLKDIHRACHPRERDGVYAEHG